MVLVIKNNQPLRDRSLHHTFAINPTAYLIPDYGFYLSLYHLSNRDPGTQIRSHLPRRQRFFFHEGHRGLPKKNKGTFLPCFPQKQKSEDMTRLEDGRPKFKWRLDAISVSQTGSRFPYTISIGLMSILQRGGPHTISYNKWMLYSV